VVDPSEVEDNALTPAVILGARIRAFRLGRRLSLRALAQSTQTSQGFLSQLERGQVIALADLFSEESIHHNKILRRAERPEIHASNLTSKYLLSQKPLLNLEVYAAELLPGGHAGEPYAHANAQEMLVVSSGAVTLVLDGIEHSLEAGDSAEYLTSALHTVRNDGDLPAEVIWIISPPTLGAQ
jgi:mannose-6-phosphate isomerase-like protein (cupin superfamily)